MGSQGSSPSDDGPADGPDPHQPEPTARPEPTAQPEPAGEPDPAVQADPAVQPDPAVRPEPATQPEPAAEPDPAGGPTKARYAKGRGRVASGRPVTRPPDPIRPFIGRALPRRRRSDWGVLIFALVVSSLILAACCAAGFALYTSGGFD